MYVAEKKEFCAGAWMTKSLQGFHFLLCCQELFGFAHCWKRSAGKWIHIFWMAYITNCALFLFLFLPHCTGNIDLILPVFRILGDILNCAVNWPECWLDFSFRKECEWIEMIRMSFMMLAEVQNTARCFLPDVVENWDSLYIYSQLSSNWMSC